MKATGIPSKETRKIILASFLQIKTENSFWKTVKSYFVEKLKSNGNISLILDNTVRVNG